MKSAHENPSRRSGADELARQAIVTQALTLVVALVIIVSLMFGDTSQTSRALADLLRIRTLLSDSSFPEVLPNYIRTVLHEPQNPYPVGPLITKTRAGAHPGRAAPAVPPKFVSYSAFKIRVIFSNFRGRSLRNPRPQRPRLSTAQ